MRIVTRPDFDGIVCAVLLQDALDIDMPIKWIQPSDMQKGLVSIQAGDVIANLPYDERASRWFDHHFSNQTTRSFEGAFRIAPSAAGIIYDHYRDRFTRDYGELSHAADKIDSADLSLNEIRRPQDHPYILISMTISGNSAEEHYWNHLVALLRCMDIDTLLKDEEVARRCQYVIEENRTYREHLRQHTHIKGPVSVTDFRELTPAPNGNRFLVYSLFPDAVVNLKIYHDGRKAVIKLGHSIINRGCKVNVGKLLTAFEGGGHRGAGACRFPVEKSDEYLEKILAVLVANEVNE